MFDDDQNDERIQAEREAKQRAKAWAAQFRKDVQEVMALPAAWRVLSAFLFDSGADLSPLRHDNLTTGHAIGWADAGGWWLNAVRQHCPEREAQMRAEARKQAHEAEEASDE